MKTISLTGQMWGKSVLHLDWTDIDKDECSIGNIVTVGDKRGHIEMYLI